MPFVFKWLKISSSVCLYP